MNNFNNDEGRRPMRPRFNNGNGGNSSEGYQSERRPRFNHDNNGEARPARNVGARFNRNTEGGYRSHTEGGYQQREGGYQARPRFNADRQEGGYRSHAEGGYQQREGGYQARPRFNAERQEGGYQQREAGYSPRPRFNADRQEGGYQQGNRRPQGGFSKPGAGARRPNNPGLYSKKKRVEYEEKYEDPTKPIRLNKYLANAGICSRREADDFILAGVITVNGIVVSELGAKVLPTDQVKFHEQPVRREKKVYILLNKPKNCVTTTDDPQERHTVMDLVKTACSERVYPVGRLDRNTTGVLLLTNDGDLAAKLTHPKFGKKKIYAATLDKDLSEEAYEELMAGIVLDDEVVVPDALEFPKEGDRKHVGLQIHSGQNRVVRRLFEKVGYKVVQLDRVSFAGLTKKNVPRGKYRFLTQQEVSYLQMGAFE